MQGSGSRGQAAGLVMDRQDGSQRTQSWNAAHWDPACFNRSCKECRTRQRTWTAAARAKRPRSTKAVFILIVSVFAVGGRQSRRSGVGNAGRDQAWNLRGRGRWRDIRFSNCTTHASGLQRPALRSRAPLKLRRTSGGLSHCLWTPEWDTHPSSLGILRGGTPHRPQPGGQLVALAASLYAYLCVWSVAATGARSDPEDRVPRVCIGPGSCMHSSSAARCRCMISRGLLSVR